MFRYVWNAESILHSTVKSYQGYNIITVSKRGEIV